MNSFIKFNNFIKETFLYSLVPLIYLIFALLLLKTGSLPDLFFLSFWEIILIVFLVLGSGLWFIGYFYLPPSAYLFPRAEKLVISDPYRFFRHPIYAGAMLIFWTLSLLAHSQPAFWYATLIIFPFILGRAKWEERILTEAFGGKYKKYKKTTLF